MKKRICEECGNEKISEWFRCAPDGEWDFLEVCEECEEKKHGR
jgi:hypothetical protein